MTSKEINQLIPTTPEGWGVNELLRQREIRELRIADAVLAIVAAEDDIKRFNEILERRGSDDTRKD